MLPLRANRRGFSGLCLLHFNESTEKFNFTKYLVRFTLLAVPFPAKTNANAILASASDIIRSDGLASLSMRTLAGRLGVRASSLYRHFPDRSSIEKTLAVRASEQLLERMQQAVLALNGERAIFAASTAYLNYATSEAAFYEMMMRSTDSLPKAEELSQLWNFFLQLVSQTTNMGLDTAGAAAVWAFLHGFTVLNHSGQLGDTSSTLIFSRGIQALVRGLSVADAESVHGSL